MNNGNNNSFNLNNSSDSNNSNNNNNNYINNIEFLPQVNSFQLPTELTKPFEDETDSDIALDSDDNEDYDIDECDSFNNSDNDEDIKHLEGNITSITPNNNGGNNKNTKSASTTTAEKKTPNAFILFAMEKRKQLKKEHPDLPMASISQILGKEWKELHPNQKKVFTEKAASMRENKNSK